MKMRVVLVTSLVALAACGGQVDGDDVGGSSGDGDGGGNVRKRDGGYDDFPLCPSLPPLEGEPCDGDGQTCTYVWPGPNPCTQGISCTGGAWKYDGASPCWH